MIGSAVCAKTVSLIAAYAVALQTLLSGMLIAPHAAPAEAILSDIICSPHSGAVAFLPEAPGQQQPICPGEWPCMLPACGDLTAPVQIAYAIPMPRASDHAASPASGTVFAPPRRATANPQIPRGPPALA